MNKLLNYLYRRFKQCLQIGTQTLHSKHCSSYTPPIYCTCPKSSIEHSKQCMLYAPSSTEIYRMLVKELNEVKCNGNT